MVTFLDNDIDRPLSYLIDQRGNHRGALRGTGFELRTDAYGALRAQQGLYLST